jgi:uncharacterized RDD family membrane protein YckC
VATLFAIGGALDKGAAWVVVGVGIFTMVVFFNQIDYLWAAFRDDRRSLHDLGAGTLVGDS